MKRMRAEKEWEDVIRAEGRLEAMIQLATTKETRLLVLDESLKCAETFAAWERAEMNAGRLEEDLMSLNQAFYTRMMAVVNLMKG